MLAKNLVAITLSVGVAGAAYLMLESDADACGCFAPPDPSVPVVQAGENILFGVENGVVTAHIQVLYSGPAEEFGWLLPLPSLPEMELGVDELFAQLIATTQPKYALVPEFRGDCSFDPSRRGGGQDAGADNAEGDPDAPPGDGGSPLVLQDSVGPYDFAVLRADSKQPMLDWLNDNGYFVPAGTDDVIDPYINPGAYFLALKLQKGNDVGDLQPVVLKYPSDLPMIPIILTSVAAEPDMGIQVWVAGDSRAIPRNYYHTTLNDAQIDWINFGANYVDVVTRAADEADGHRTFVTEYAGTSDVMVDVLDPAWRFGDLDYLATVADAVQYVSYLNSNGYPIQRQVPPFGLQYSSQMIAVLQRHLPIPQKLETELEITPNQYYANFGYYVTYHRVDFPEYYTDLDLVFDPVEMTAEIDERFVKPSRLAGEMFRTHPYLTRMFTTLSPEEMTRDPVFSFNPELQEYGNNHSGRIIYYCDGSGTEQAQTPARIITEAGFELNLPKGTGQNPWVDSPAMPDSQYIGVVREQGGEEIVVDNTRVIVAALAGRDSGGCSVGHGRSTLPIGLSLLGLGALAFIRRRRGR